MAGLGIIKVIPIPLSLILPGTQNGYFKYYIQHLFCNKEALNFARSLNSVLTSSKVKQNVLTYLILRK